MCECLAVETEEGLGGFLAPGQGEQRIIELSVNLLRHAATLSYHMDGLAPSEE